MHPLFQSKHDSSLLPGSVFIIASDGSVLNLPIPSTLPNDPLNWSFKKRALALTAVGIFSSVGAALSQGASLLMNGLSEEFGPAEVMLILCSIGKGYTNIPLSKMQSYV